MPQLRQRNDNNFDFRDPVMILLSDVGQQLSLYTDFTLGSILYDIKKNYGS